MHCIWGQESIIILPGRQYREPVSPGLGVSRRQPRITIYVPLNLENYTFNHLHAFCLYSSTRPLSFRFRPNLLKHSRPRRYGVLGRQSRLHFRSCPGRSENVRLPSSRRGGWLCTGGVTYASLCLKSRVGTDTVSAGKTWVTPAEKKLDRAVEWVIDKWQ